MIDCVIPFGNGSSQKNIELMFCLRSLEKYMSGVRNVFIIGQPPPVFINPDSVIHIPYEDDARSRFRDRNIMRKMMEACKDTRVSDPFIMVHDDHFLLDHYDAEQFPYYHHGPILPGVGQYGDTKRNTLAVLSEHALNYDSHCPMVFNKFLFKWVMKDVDWNKYYGYLMKSIYCFPGKTGEHMPDLKIRMPLKKDEIYEQLAGRRWFSIGDKCWTDNGMKELLYELYPNKSKYEK
jgi:hypothetical protein